MKPLSDTWLDLADAEPRDLRRAVRDLACANPWVVAGGLSWPEVKHLAQTLLERNDK
jgi:hypothetical protein